MLQFGVALDAAGGLVAVDERKLDVHQDQVGSLRSRHRERLLAVVGFNHQKASACEQVAKDLPIVLLILNDEYRLVHYRAACHSIRAGAVNENVAPAPGLESTQMRPPCISTMRFAIARPRPEPILVFVIEPSTCRNSSKILA